MCHVIYGRSIKRKHCLFSLIYRTIYGRQYTSFFGIRYAKNPVDSLFLKKPIPALPWNGVFMADQEIKCLQVRNIYNYAKHKHFGPNFIREMDIR